MREILFRALTLEGNIIYDIGKIEFFTDGTILINDEIPVKQLMQWTGLVDCKGNQIFEGDIVAHEEQVMSDNEEDLPNYINKRVEPNFKYYDGSIGERRWGRKIEIVKWEKSSCGFEPFSDSQSNCGHCGGGISPNGIEVIGNRFHNPELIKE